MKRLFCFGRRGKAARALVESAWTYRHPPRTGRVKHYVLEKLSASVKDIVWKAQTRLCARYRALAGRGKPERFR